MAVVMMVMIMMKMCHCWWICCCSLFGLPKPLVRTLLHELVTILLLLLAQLTFPTPPSSQSARQPAPKIPSLKKLSLYHSQSLLLLLLLDFLSIQSTISAMGTALSGWYSELQVLSLKIQSSCFLHLILPPYYIKLCNECCTQQQPQLPHPCEEEIQISSFLSWNFQSTNPKKIQGVQLQTQNFQTHKSFFFSLVFWFLKPTPPKKKI